jgi:hypothetical protein
VVPLIQSFITEASIIKESKCTEEAKLNEKKTVARKCRNGVVKKVVLFSVQRILYIPHNAQLLNTRAFSRHQSDQTFGENGPSCFKNRPRLSLSKNIFYPKSEN